LVPQAVAPVAAGEEESGGAVKEGAAAEPEVSEEAEATVEAERQDDPIARLEALTDADMDDFMSSIMPAGTRCLYIMSIVVSPAHQGRGVGTALIQHGTRRADQEGVFAWVHASEAGAGMFERQGFEEVRRLRVDLDEYCGGRRVPEGVDKQGDKETGWGDYTFRYMVRKPRDA